MKPNNPQQTEMFSDYVKAWKYVDSGWKRIAGNILTYIKDGSVTEPDKLMEYIAKSQGDKSRARDIILDFFNYYEEKTGKKYTSTEQYIMYRKCMILGDKSAAKQVLATNDPEQQ